MPKEKLTPQEMKFCQYVAVDGMTATDAYMTAYKTKNRKTARENGCKIQKKDRIAQKIQDLRERQAYSLSWSRQQAEENLTVIVKESMQDGNPKAMSNAIKAISELNRMCGYYAPTKTQSLNIEVGAGDIDAIMLNLGFKRTSLLESEND